MLFRSLIVFLVLIILILLIILFFLVRKSFQLSDQIDNVEILLEESIHLLENSYEKVKIKSEIELFSGNSKYELYYLILSIYY